VDLTTLAINTVPFGIVVGEGVLQGAGPGKLDNLSMSDLYQIFNGTVRNWTTIGNTTDRDTDITVCHRTPGSGTLATLVQTIMKKGPTAINGVRTPATGPPILGSYGNIGNASSQNMLDCMNNAVVGGMPQNPNFRMSIGYIDSDSLPLLPPWRPLREDQRLPGVRLYYGATPRGHQRAAERFALRRLSLLGQLEPDRQDQRSRWARGSGRYGRHRSGASRHAGAT
jgi:hypothetical protein